MNINIGSIIVKIVPWCYKTLIIGEMDVGIGKFPLSSRLSCISNTNLKFKSHLRIDLSLTWKE